jgi:hypothetical protein
MIYIYFIFIYLFRIYFNFISVIKSKVHNPIAYTLFTKKFPRNKEDFCSAGNCVIEAQIAYRDLPFEVLLKSEYFSWLK